MRAWHEEYRYRVIEVLVAEAGYVEAFDIREFKTIQAARNCERRWLREGKSVLFQTAKVTWLTPDEYEAELATLPKARE